ncbi:hypothetical protein EJ06DRAFT_555215 [Trichodelitschia bisporula]|uniref:Uncharacterized protein n=1 Tax=Trichodelitschia bisporula TaxID=703511 RepID=A0A6G1I2X5_9PEZI|nr:hypothetical protein EJ06DRAFT_555215 [Trichodelitschia bisporula]
MPNWRKWKEIGQQLEEKRQRMLESLSCEQRNNAKDERQRKYEEKRQRLELQRLEDLVREQNAREVSPTLMAEEREMRLAEYWYRDFLDREYEENGQRLDSQRFESPVQEQRENAREDSRALTDNSLVRDLVKDLCQEFRNRRYEEERQRLDSQRFEDLVQEQSAGEESQPLTDEDEDLVNALAGDLEQMFLNQEHEENIHPLDSQRIEKLLQEQQDRARVDFRTLADDSPVNELAEDLNQDFLSREYEEDRQCLDSPRFEDLAQEQQKEARGESQTSTDGEDPATVLTEALEYAFIHREYDENRYPLFEKLLQEQQERARAESARLLDDYLDIKLQEDLNQEEVQRAEIRYLDQVDVWQRLRDVHALYRARREEAEDKDADPRTWLRPGVNGGEVRVLCFVSDDHLPLAVWIHVDALLADLVDEVKWEVAPRWGAVHPRRIEVFPVSVEWGEEGGHEEAVRQAEEAELLDFEGAVERWARPGHVVLFFRPTGIWPRIEGDGDGDWSEGGGGDGDESEEEDGDGDGSEEEEEDGDWSDVVEQGWREVYDGIARAGAT